MVRTIIPITIDSRTGEQRYVRFSVEGFGWNFIQDPAVIVPVHVYFEDENGNIAQRPDMDIKPPLTYKKETFIEMIGETKVKDLPDLKDQLLMSEIAAYPEKFWGLQLQNLEII